MFHASSGAPLGRAEAMSDDARTNEDPTVVGVPPETPEAVRPSATGLVAGPVEGETDVELAEPGASSSGEEVVDGAGIDRVLEDAEGGVEGSLLDAAPDES